MDDEKRKHRKSALNSGGSKSIELEPTTSEDLRAHNSERRYQPVDLRDRHKSAGSEASVAESVRKMVRSTTFLSSFYRYFHITVFQALCVVDESL